MPTHVCQLCGTLTHYEFFCEEPNVHCQNEVHYCQECANWSNGLPMPRIVCPEHFRNKHARVRRRLDGIVLRPPHFRTRRMIRSAYDRMVEQELEAEADEMARAYESRP